MWSLFSPAHPVAFFHPPTHRLLCNRSPGTRLVTRCPQRSLESRSSSSFFSGGGPLSLKRARTFSPTQPCARRDVRFAHVSTALQRILPSSLVLSSGRGLVDLLLRAWTSTAFLRIRWIWCARSASTGDHQPSGPSFWCAAFREHKRLTGRPLSPTPGGVRGRAVIGDRPRNLSSSK